MKPKELMKWNPKGSQEILFWMHNEEGNWTGSKWHEKKNETEWNENGMNNDVWMNVILARMNRLLLEQTTCGNKLKQERMIGEIKDWLS